MKYLSAVLLLAVTFMACQPKMKFSFDQETDLLMHVQMPNKKDDFKRIFLVRHAEKQAGSNPELTAEGVERAKQLAIVLGEIGIEQIYSTDYKRTMATAQPLATKLGLGITQYDAKELPAFKELILSKSGKTSLVVGHSNTTPQVVNLIANTNYKEISHETYDNLFLLTIKNDQEVEVEVFKF